MNVGETAKRTEKYDIINNWEKSTLLNSHLEFIGRKV